MSPSYCWINQDSMVWLAGGSKPCYIALLQLYIAT